MTCGADFKETVSVQAAKTKARIYVTEVTSLRHVDVCKRRSPENDSHRNLIKQNLACFVEYFLKMYEIATAKVGMSKFYTYFL